MVLVTIFSFFETVQWIHPQTKLLHFSNPGINYREAPKFYHSMIYILFKVSTSGKKQNVFNKDDKYVLSNFIDRGHE